MNFFDEILFKTGLSPENAVGPKVLWIDFRAVFIEGHKGLVKMAPDEISFRLGRRVLSVRGENLKINELTEDEAYVVGKISSVEGLDG